MNLHFKFLVLISFQIDLDLNGEQVDSANVQSPVFRPEVTPDDMRVTPETSSSPSRCFYCSSFRTESAMDSRADSGQNLQ